MVALFVQCRSGTPMNLLRLPIRRTSAFGCSVLSESSDEICKASCCAGLSLPFFASVQASQSKKTPTAWFKATARMSPSCRQVCRQAGKQAGLFLGQQPAEEDVSADVRYYSESPKRGKGGTRNGAPSSSARTEEGRRVALLRVFGTTRMRECMYVC